MNLLDRLYSRHFGLVKENPTTNTDSDREKPRQANPVVVSSGGGKAEAEDDGSRKKNTRPLVEQTITPDK